eukprot:scaffold194636_cov22-Tisochrysis_lutea.AAC.3
MHKALMYGIGRGSPQGRAAAFPGGHPGPCWQGSPASKSASASAASPSGPAAWWARPCMHD